MFKTSFIIVCLIQFISLNCICQNKANKIDLGIRDSWSRENSYEISIFPPEGTDINAKMTINSYKATEKISIISAHDYLELLKLIDEIHYKNDYNKGSFCADGTSVTLDYEISKKCYISIGCFRYKNNRYTDVSKVIKYIDLLSDQISFDFE